jgi:hypothetical protein
MGLPPIVTGVSPKEGPPGTRVTIRGENFGSGPDDIIGKIKKNFMLNCYSCLLCRSNNLQLRLFAIC